MSFAIGENVGPYRITAQLGSGGMATVYKAYHAALDRYVAIKVLHPAFKEDPNFLARFQREARIVARLEHPHIVPVYDFSEHAGQPYLVMRFIEGETLKARLQRDPLTIPQIVDIVRPVCQALTYAHEQGVLHRDIKPSNILLTPNGGVFLTDFGLARIAQAGESTLTRDTMIGTPQYISPEQARGQSDLDGRTDIYSFGVVLYELLVGRVPYQADTPYAVVHDHIFTPLPLPRSLNPNLSESLERVLLKALAKERHDRYVTVAEMLTAFEKAVAEASAPAPVAAAPLEPTIEQKATPAEAAPLPEPAAPPPPPQAPAEAVASQPSSPPTAKKSHRKLHIALGAVGLLLCCCLVVFTFNVARRQQALEGARQLRQAGRLEEALVEYERIRQQDPHAIEAYLEPAEMLAGSRDPPALRRAAELCEQGIGVMPNEGRLHACAMRTWFAVGDIERAAPHVDWLLQHKAGGALPHAAQAMILLRQDQVEAARQEAQNAIALDKDSPEAHLALGAVLARMKQFEQARIELRFVLDSPGAPAWLKEQAQRLLNELPR